MRRFTVSVLLACWFAILAAPHRALHAGANEIRPEINEIIITTSKTHLLLFCRVKNGFSDSMIQGMKNGIPVTFTFQVELEQQVDYWFDTTLMEKEFTHTLRFDPVKQRYQVSLGEQKGRVVETASLEEAKTVMQEVNGVPVVPLDRLVPDTQYAIRIKAKLAKKGLPLGSRHLVPFVSLWDFETGWRTVNFTY